MTDNFALDMAVRSLPRGDMISLLRTQNEAYRKLLADKVRKAYSNECKWNG